MNNGEYFSNLRLFNELEMIMIFAWLYEKAF